MNTMNDINTISGYDYGQASVSTSPVSMEELKKLEQAAGLTDEDNLRLPVMAAILAPQAEDLVNAWRSVIGAQPHLAQVFARADGKPDDEYKAAVKKRFVQWVRDVCERPRDQATSASCALNLQEEEVRRRFN